MTPELPRYDRTCRRDFLRRAALFGTIGLVPGIACGTDDAEVLGDQAAVTTSAPTSAAPTTTTPQDATSPEGGDTTDSTSSDALPEGAALELSFTYAAVGSGRVRNPYIAAWVESPGGELVRNLALWYNPPKGNRYVNELSSWYAADEAYYREHGTDDLASVTGASRPAGTYTLRWDGLDEAGTPVPRGDYVVLVESAREHGPHSLIYAAITLGERSVDAELGTDGELTGGTVEYSA